MPTYICSGVLKFLPTPRETIKIINLCRVANTKRSHGSRKSNFPNKHFRNLLTYVCMVLCSRNCAPHSVCCVCTVVSAVYIHRRYLRLLSCGIRVHSNMVWWVSRRPLFIPWDEKSCFCCYFEKPLKMRNYTLKTDPQRFTYVQNNFILMLWWNSVQFFMFHVLIRWSWFWFKLS